MHFAQRVFKNSNFYSKCMAHYKLFCHPAILRIFENQYILKN